MTAQCLPDDPTLFDARADRSPTGWMVTVRGDVDAVTAPRLADVLSEALSRPGATVDVDLRAVTFLDSAGLTALVGAHQEAQHAGRALRVDPGTSRAVVRPLTITGLTGVLQFVDAAEATAQAE